MLRFWLLLFLPILLSAQNDKASIWEARRKAYPDLVATYDLAEIAPGPLRSLALVKIAKVPELNDRKWKKELLAESFEAASSATIPWRLVWVSQPNGPMPRLPKRMLIVMTANQGLDRLGLQMQAVLGMLPLDRKAALEEFSRMPFPEATPMSCTIGLVPRFKEYFTLATALSLPLESLQEILSRVNSPLHVAGAAEMISKTKLSGEDRMALASAFAQRLESISGDDRAFSQSVAMDGDAVLGLASLGYESVVWKAWRTYLVRNLSGTRCKESVDQKYHYPGQTRRPVDSFNEHVQGREDIRPIDPEEIKPGKVDVGVEDELLPPQSTGSMNALQQWAELGNQKVENAASTAKVDAMLKNIEDMKVEDGQDSLDLIWSKCRSLGGLVTALVPGANRDRVLSRYLSLLAVSNLPPERLPEWYEAVISVARMSRSIQNGDTYIPTAMEQSGNPLVSLVGRLERMP